MLLGDVIEHFNKTITEGVNHCSPARSRALQQQQCYLLEHLQRNATLNKCKAIELNIENEANLFLGFECIIGAVLCELRMWILLKLDRADQAWDQLISAQMAAMDALRAHEGFSNATIILKRLEDYEEVLFPPQAFVSAGFISKSIECSICNKEYSDCDHLRNKPYMGKFCDVIHRGITGDHIAMVKFPADKRCRFTSYKTPSGHQNKMTLEITEYKDKEEYRDDGTLEAKAIFFALDRYPYFKPTDQVLVDSPKSEI